MQNILFHGDDHQLFRLNRSTFDNMSAWERERLCAGVATSIGVNIGFLPKCDFTRRRSEIQPFQMSRSQVIQLKKQEFVLTYPGEKNRFPEIITEIDTLIASFPIRDKVLMTMELPDAVLRDLYGKNYLFATAEIVTYQFPYVKGGWNIPVCSDFYYVSYCSADISDESIIVLALF